MAKVQTLGTEYAHRPYFLTCGRRHEDSVPESTRLSLVTNDTGPCYNLHAIYRTAPARMREHLSVLFMLAFVCAIVAASVYKIELPASATEHSLI